ncbi:aldehyde dehydrogenase family protein [Tahibacter sp.]|uniref:aldehyde dehydrogenase family protein n=1 Tax=Tahibacter sp. TaxID=2056211 RepID=UPI0028C4523F|nr:aldehyde dehydrogenase family protein [Tahibacter sp.]
MNATTAISPQRPALPAATADFLQRAKQLLINNRWVDAQSGARIPVKDPARGETIVQVAAAAAAAADVELAVAAARTAFRRWSTQRPTFRARPLFKLADLLERHAAEFAELESLDVGKPLMITRMVAPNPCALAATSSTAMPNSRSSTAAPTTASRQSFRSPYSTKPGGAGVGLLLWRKIGQVPRAGETGQLQRRNRRS